MASIDASITDEFEHVEFRKPFRVSPVVDENQQENTVSEPQTPRRENGANSELTYPQGKRNSTEPTRPKRFSDIRYDRTKVNIGSKNGTMVLQLVLPSESQNSSNLESNYYTTTSIDEIISTRSNTNKRIINRESHLDDGYSTASNDFSRSEYNRSFQMVSQPQTPVSTSSQREESKSTSIEEKKRHFRNHLTTIISSMYALFIVTLGLVVYICDVIIGNHPIAETFSLYLVVISLVFIVYLIADVRIYMHKRQRHNNLLEKNIAQEIELKETPTGDFHFSITLPEAARAMKQLEHHYCLSKDRHSANFYLKCGAAGFCVGHLIHSGLLLGYQIMFLTSNGEEFYECASIVTLILDIVYPVYSFSLLYFIFKYSNIIINRHIALVRFGLMHCISSSLCFWIWTILRETLDTLSNHKDTDDDKTDTSTTEIAFYTSPDLPLALPLTSYSKKGAQLLTSYLNTSTRQFLGHCQNDAGLKLIYQNYSPYLYPFSVEYSILVVGVLFVIWQNIGRCKTEMLTSQSQQCDSPEGNGDNLESNVVIHADCHSANKGLFSGIAVMVLTLVTIILYFITISNDRTTQAALINVLHSLFIVVLMDIAGIFLYRQITRLDVNPSHVSVLDDLLLFICIPAFFLNAIFTVIPAIHHKSTSMISLVVIDTMQVLIQTPLIIDGLRRCSNSRELRKQKPGRELLTFLIVCNVALWITQTFEIKSYGFQDDRYDFYGKELWTIVGHMCLPLMMFYRFHSSVCLVDIWKYAYEPANE